MRTWGYVAGSAVIVLAGCSGPGATVNDLGASPTTGSRPTQSPPSSAPTSSTPTASAGGACVSLSADALAAVDLAVRRKGEGNSVPLASALHDPDSGMWIIVGTFAGPLAEGEGALGIWATKQDPRDDDFDSPILAVDDAASAASTADPAKTVPFDPNSMPVLRCLGDQG